MIPKIIHFVWLGSKELPLKNQKYMESWKEKCPDYKIMCWNESNFDIEKSCDYVKEAYKNKKYAFVSDYIRLYALYNYGGIYFDTDVDVLKNFDVFLDNKFFIGHENSAFLSTAVIGAEKQNPIINELLKTYENEHFENKNGELNLKTNVERFSCFLKKKYNYPLKNSNFKTNEISIFSSLYFSPKDYFSEKIHSTKNSFAIHEFEGSWDTKNKSFTKKMAKSFFKILPKHIGFFLINMLKNQQLKKKLK